MSLPLDRIAARSRPDVDGLSAEYKTLRDEILQLYREQAQLAFASTLPLLGSLLLKEPTQSSMKWLMLASALLLLGGVSWKLRANYYKIFCLGTYLAVVHERKGKTPEEFAPGADHPGWHTRWRKVDAAPALHPHLKGQLGRASAQADAAFVASIAAALIALAVGQDLGALISNALAQKMTFPGSGFTSVVMAQNGTTLVGIGISVLALGFLLFNLRQLWNIQKYVGNYREELELLIAQGKC